MRSIYEQAMGSDFKRLHPEIQRRFGFSSRDNIASIGTGVMDEIWHGPVYTLPFLYLGSWRRILFQKRVPTFRFKFRTTPTWIHWDEKPLPGFVPSEITAHVDLTPT